MSGIKKTLIKVLLILGYYTPFVFLAMNEDVTHGTLWFYLVMIIGFAGLCYGCVKTKSWWILVAGNILSFASSIIFTYFFRNEKWEWYFKPFTPYQSVIFETIIAFIIQMIFAICIIKKHKSTDKD